MTSFTTGSIANDGLYNCWLKGTSSDTRYDLSEDRLTASRYGIDIHCHHPNFIALPSPTNNLLVMYWIGDGGSQTIRTVLPYWRGRAIIDFHVHLLLCPFHQAHIYWIL
jgi:hypothetical protein